MTRGVLRIRTTSGLMVVSPSIKQEWEKITSQTGAAPEKAVSGLETRENASNKTMYESTVRNEGF